MTTAARPVRELLAYDGQADSLIAGRQTDTGANGQDAIDLADHGRLQQPNRGDQGHEVLVHLLGQGRPARIVGIEAKRARVDTAE